MHDDDFGQCHAMYVFVAHMHVLEHGLSCKSYLCQSQDPETHRQVSQTVQVQSSSHSGYDGLSQCMLCLKLHALTFHSPTHARHSNPTMHLLYLHCLSCINIPPASAEQLPQPVQARGQ